MSLKSNRQNLSLALSVTVGITCMIPGILFKPTGECLAQGQLLGSHSSVFGHKCGLGAPSALGRNRSPAIS